MNQELVTKESNVPQTSSISGAAIAPTDILIPRVLLQQNTSQFVNDDKADPGDFVRSTNAEVLGGRDKPLSFIPIAFLQRWVIFEKDGNKIKFKGYEEYTAKNANQDWSYEEDGVEYRRDKSIELYVLLTKDIEAEAKELEAAKKEGGYPDPDKALLPCVISFRRTSFKAGQKLLTHFEKARSFNVPGYVSTFKLSNTKVSNDLGTFFVLDAEKEGKSNALQLQVAAKWHSMILQGGAQIHEVEEAEPVTSSAKDSNDY